MMVGKFRRLSNMYDGFKFKKYLQGVRVSKFEATRGPGRNSQRARKTFLMTISLVSLRQGKATTM